MRFFNLEFKYFDVFQEHEAELMSIHKQPKETLEDKAAYDELKALNHYNKPAGMTIDIFLLI